MKAKHVVLFLGLALVVGVFFLGRGCDGDDEAAQARLAELEGRLDVVEAEASTATAMADAAMADAAVARSVAVHAEFATAVFGEKLAEVVEDRASIHQRMDDAEERIRRAWLHIEAMKAKGGVAMTPPAVADATRPAPRPKPIPAAAPIRFVPSDGEGEEDGVSNATMEEDCWSVATAQQDGANSSPTSLTRTEGGSHGCFLTKEAAIIAACNGRPGRLISSGDGVDILECEPPPK
ncbi:MAG: hypothetical protein A2538_02160 [Candidatus Magasanikbacteria bacterium RIFOXYD2_FULL_41_14]|uniref:Uncharacterized protein n=1 Tax=Candidatus Magasanikbacteria bacterium RIFOXYD2_FULL_41_14 TaxID=1798709 RepID=A0A1F6PDM3_9BACT|nr:MAG: hypothetical protein A2538_02160 [Candidatus Magasanikbacteria bacterium RIFOXYD2_FULL_41_14]